MDKQEWFERFTRKLKFEEDRYVISPETLFEDWRTLKIALLEMAVDLLPGLEKRIIKLIYNKGLSERKVAERLGISRAKVQRRKKKAVKMLAESFLARFALPRLRET